MYDRGKETGAGLKALKGSGALGVRRDNQPLRRISYNRWTSNPMHRFFPLVLLAATVSFAQQRQSPMATAGNQKASQGAGLPHFADVGRQPVLTEYHISSQE